MAAPGDVYDARAAAVALDLSGRALRTLPDILNAEYICALYLHNNAIEEIPDDFFPTLPNLMWLDLRDNQITAIPKTIRFHVNLSHLLLQKNKITALPNELGTVTNLKTLQLSGNPLQYPPNNITEQGVGSILKYLNTKFEEKLTEKFDVISEDSGDVSTVSSDIGHGLSSSDTTNEFISAGKTNLKKSKVNTPLSIELSDKEVQINKDVHIPYAKSEGKCPKLPQARQKALPNYCQSKKYLKPLRANCKDEQTMKMRQCYLRDLAQTKCKELLAQREKVLQDRKNFHLLRDWRNNYKKTQMMRSQIGSSYTFDPNNLPYDTNPDCMVLLSREDLEKDLPDKYRKRLIRKSKSSVPRRNSGDQQLANKIKQLFENLEKINLNRESMTPRTEQQMLLNEIHKISEIRQKLTQLSSTNFQSTNA